MSDVFISYARSTVKQAEQVADALRSLGHEVWLDTQIPAHRAFADEIEQRLNAAKAVVVIWSAEAVKSQWVQSEADRARQDGKLVQLSLDGARLPMPFDRIQCADLTGWSGDPKAPGWRNVLASVSELTGSASPPSPVPRGTVESTEPLLAVLAFDNLSGDPEMAYFSDGVSEEIQQTVAKGAGLKVIGRTSSFQYRGADKVVRRLAADLHATHLLDGSVRRSGSRVRISAQLVECATETTLWSERFDRDLQDIFALQDEIAAAVADALRATFVAASTTARIDPGAYDLYLRARSEERTDERIGLLEQAVRLAPEFAAAWAELSHVRAIVHRGILLDDQATPVARSAAVAAAEMALRLDPNSGTAYATLATLLPWGDYGGRESQLQRALAVAPNATRAIIDTGWFLLSVGRNEEALEQAARALNLDPLNRGAALLRSLMLCATGHYEEGQRAFEAARVRWPLEPAVTLGPMLLAAFRHDWPRHDRLRRELERLGYWGRETRDALFVGELLREPTPQNRLRCVDAVASHLADTGTVEVGRLAVAYDMGMDDETFSFVEKASFAHLHDESGRPPGGSYSPGFIFDLTPHRTMMQDVRFVRLCAKLGLCDYWVRTGRWPDCVQLVAYDFKAECRRVAGAHA